MVYALGMLISLSATVNFSNNVSTDYLVYETGRADTDYMNRYIGWGTTNVYYLDGWRIPVAIQDSVNGGFPSSVVIHAKFTSFEDNNNEIYFDNWCTLTYGSIGTYAQTLYGTNGLVGNYVNYTCTGACFDNAFSTSYKFFDVEFVSLRNVGGALSVYNNVNPVWNISVVNETPESRSYNYFAYNGSNINNYAGLFVINFPSINVFSNVNQTDVDNAYNNGYTNGYTNGYDTGYDVGSQDGYNAGYDEGETDGTYAGYEDGYLYGYNIGVAEGENNANTYTFGNLFKSIVDTPIWFLQSLFGFSLFGQGETLMGIITSLITALIVIALVKKVF